MVLLGTFEAFYIFASSKISFWQCCWGAQALKECFASAVRGTLAVFMGAFASAVGGGALYILRTRVPVSSCSYPLKEIQKKEKIIPARKKIFGKRVKSGKNKLIISNAQNS